MAYEFWAVGMLASGALVSSEAAIYTVPADTRVVVKQIHVHNNTGSTQAVRIEYRPSGGVAADDVPVGTPSLLTGESADILEEALELNEGDQLRGICSSGTTTMYTITGVVNT